MTSPPTVTTLIELLTYRALATPDKIAFTFEQQATTYAQLWSRIVRAGLCLHQYGVRHGDRVVIVFPNGDEFFDVFYGVQRAGGTAVPVFPGLGPQQILQIATLSRARLIVVPSNTPQQQVEQFNALASRNDMRVMTLATCDEDPADVTLPDVQPDDIAFIQYTSGSTGDPKGVQLSHRSLLMNVQQLIAGMEVTSDDRFVSWLPVYHDMGLIFMTMVPFYLAAEVFLLSTSLKRVDQWLTTIQATRGTLTAAPDFAYRLCLRHIPDHSRFDLSSLRLALNAAEPVRAETITAFETAFGLKNVMIAGYGLAEATVGVSTWQPGHPPKVDARGFVSVGKPFVDVEIRIEQDGHSLAPGEVGDILIRSTANCAGYDNYPQANAETFRDDGFFYSGDVGYLDADGCLYIVGRKKNIIIQAGRNIAPHEIEEIVDSRDEVRYAAATGIDKGDVAGEQAYVFAELRDGEHLSGDELTAIATDIVAAIHAGLGLRPARLYLVKPHTIPLTHNGKVRHGDLKAQYLDGRLREVGAILFPDS